MTAVARRERILGDNHESTRVFADGFRGRGFAVQAEQARSAEKLAIQSFQSNGVKIVYFVQGHGEPVVLIHGWLSSAGINWALPGIAGSVVQELPGDCPRRARTWAIGQADQGRCLWTRVGRRRDPSDGSSPHQKGPHRRLFDGRNHRGLIHSASSRPHSFRDALRHGMAEDGKRTAVDVCSN